MLVKRYLLLIVIGLNLVQRAECGFMEAEPFTKLQHRMQLKAKQISPLQMLNLKAKKELFGQSVVNDLCFATSGADIWLKKQGLLGERAGVAQEAACIKEHLFQHSSAILKTECTLERLFGSVGADLALVLLFDDTYRCQNLNSRHLWTTTVSDEEIANYIFPCGKTLSEIVKIGRQYRNDIIMVAQSSVLGKSIARLNGKYVLECITSSGYAGLPFSQQILAIDEQAAYQQKLARNGLSILRCAESIKAAIIDNFDNVYSVMLLVGLSVFLNQTVITVKEKRGQRFVDGFCAKEAFCRTKNLDFANSLSCVKEYVRGECGLSAPDYCLARICVRELFRARCITVAAPQKVVAL